MDAATALVFRKGIAHRSALSALGVTDRHIASAVRSGAIERLRREWYALPGNTTDTARAVRLGGQAACITAARARELWVLDDRLLHVRLAPNSGRHAVEGCRVHWSVPRAPMPHSPIESVHDMLVHVARCQGFESAVCVFDSALNKRLITHDEMLQLGRHIGGAFHRVAQASTPLSDSGIETIPRLRFAELGIRMEPQVSVDGHRLDGRIGERLLLQFDGLGPHSSRAQREKDLREDARLRLQGHPIFRFLGSQVLEQWDFVEHTVLSAMAQGLHRAPR